MQLSNVIEVSRQQILDREIIEVAMEKSPTGGNAKPFAWKWDGELLVIQHNAELARHYLNPENQASWIALGCLLASIEIAASAQGWTVDVELTPSVGALVSFLRSQKNLQGTVALGDLLIRSTYREAFQASIPPEISAVPSQNGIGVHLAPYQLLTDTFLRYVRETDAYLWLQKKATESFLREVRFFDTRVEPRGIRSMDLGVGLMDQLMLYLLKSTPSVFSLMARIPGVKNLLMKASNRNLKNAHFFLVTALDLKPHSLVQAGQAAMRTWVELEALGYKAQPYSMASLTLVAAENGHLPADTQAQFQELFQTVGPQLMRQQFSLRPQEKPVWMFRVGKAK